MRRWPLDQKAEQYEDGPYYQLHDNYGDLLDKLGRRGEALAEYGKAIQEILRMRLRTMPPAVNLPAPGKPDSALREFAQAEQLDPHFAWPHVETAQLLLKSGRDTEAMNELRTALRLEPDNPQVLALTAHILAANENAAARDGKTALCSRRKRTISPATPNR